MNIITDITRYTVSWFISVEAYSVIQENRNSREKRQVWPAWLGRGRLCLENDA